MAKQVVIVISSDVEIIAAAQSAYGRNSRNPVYVFGYKVRYNPVGWSMYDGLNWIPVAGFPNLQEAYYLVFSGHGNSDEIGREDEHDVGPDLSPKDTASLMEAIGFTGSRIVLSVCGTHGIYNTFANKLAAASKGIKAGTKIYYPTKSLDADRNPTSIVDMDAIEIGT